MSELWFVQVKRGEYVWNVGLECMLDYLELVKDVRFRDLSALVNEREAVIDGYLLQMHSPVRDGTICAFCGESLAHECDHETYERKVKEHASKKDA